MLQPCRECGAPCRVEVFGPSPAIKQPVSLWMCANHKRFGGDCSSDLAYFDEVAWNARPMTGQHPASVALIAAQRLAAAGHPVEEVSVAPGFLPLFNIGGIARDVTIGQLVDIATQRGLLAKPSP